MTNITVPVLLEFDQNKAVGQLIINKKQLPARSDYVFALGVRHLDSEGSYELVCISIVDDENYAEYLKQRGVV